MNTYSEDAGLLECDAVPSGEWFDSGMNTYSEDAGLLECDDMPSGEWFPMLERNIVPSSSRVKQSKKNGSHILLGLPDLLLWG
jgi:hypothetical protein